MWLSVIRCEFGILCDWVWLGCVYEGMSGIEYEYGFVFECEGLWVYEGEGLNVSEWLWLSELILVSVMVGVEWD